MMNFNIESMTITLTEWERNRIRLFGAVPELSADEQNVMKPVHELFRNRGLLGNEELSKLDMRRAQEILDEEATCQYESGMLSALRKAFGTTFEAAYESHINDPEDSAKLSVQGFIAEFLDQHADPVAATEDVPS